ncbi:uncharacterized protein TNCV_3891511 [Trichonephila clavipes]|nr:uncharacterized protein TNCV_3891511 [Trichonephila clavipes]
MRILSAYSLSDGDTKTAEREMVILFGTVFRNCGGGDRGRVAIYRPFGEVSLSLNRTVTCMVLKANDRRTSCPCHDEFRGPRSDYVRQLTTNCIYATEVEAIVDLLGLMNSVSDAEIDNEALIKTVTFSNALHGLETENLPYAARYK